MSPDSLQFFRGFSLRPGCVEEGGAVKTGTLANRDGRQVPIRGFIPRFRMDEGYTANFGDQWNRFRRTQLDSQNGTTITAERFFRGTGWPGRMDGELVLEVGCGAGRFTEILLGTGATVVAVDYSSAVDACWANHGPHPRLVVVQADLFDLPFEPQSFDRVFCYGVLQHTPDPRAAFLQLAGYVKPGGHIAIDAYAREAGPSRWTSKYLWRPLTTRLRPQILRRIVSTYVPLWLPVDNAIKNVPGLRRLTTIVPCWNYGGTLPLGRRELREWAILDTFDALGARYDFPQTIESVRDWLRAAGLPDDDVRRGGNGIEANAARPPAPTEDLRVRTTG